MFTGCQIPCKTDNKIIWSVQMTGNIIRWCNYYGFGFIKYQLDWKYSACKSIWLQFPNSFWDDWSVGWHHSLVPKLQQCSHSSLLVDTLLGVWLTIHFRIKVHLWKKDLGGARSHWRTKNKKYTVTIKLTLVFYLVCCAFCTDQYYSYHSQPLHLHWNNHNITLVAVNQ